MRGFDGELRDQAGACRAQVLAACAAPEPAQAAILDAIVAAHRDTPFGIEHDLASVRGYDEFAQRVPVRSYDELEPWLSGERACLARTCCFEPTTGSTGAAKLIPYSSAFLAELRIGALAWLASTLGRHPACTRGRAYWTLSPLTRAARVHHRGVAVGLDSDLAYLGPAAASLAQGLVVPDLAQAGWRLETLRALVAEPDLRWLSLWSPTFFLALLGEDGGGEALAQLRRTGVVGAARLDRFARALRESNLNLLWPDLELISCWASAASAAPARELARLFPHARLEPKGLLATEGIVSLPLDDAPSPVLAVASHFLEFVDGGGQVRRAHELERGGEYEVLLTTGAGLFRYRLGDRVRVTAHFRSTPCVEFTGRAQVVDLCGEKLSEGFAGHVLERAQLEVQGCAGAVLHPDADGRGYVCLADVASEAVALRLRARVEALLADNPHYAYARRLGQLRPLQVRRVAALNLRLHRWFEQGGARAGDVKLRPLLSTAPAGFDAGVGLLEDCVMNDFNDALLGDVCERDTAACDAGTIPAGADFYRASGQLTRFWYVAARSAEVRQGRLARARLFGRDFVLLRTAAGVSAFPDQCLHRGAALSAGRVESDCIRCPYHGWTFDAAGAVRAVPSLPPGAPLPRLSLRRVPVEERDGLVWICPGEGAPLNTPFAMPFHADPQWVTYYMVTDFDNNVVNLAENFVDVPHTVFVHDGIFRSRQSKLVECRLETTAASVEVTYDHADDAIGMFPWLLNPDRAPMVHTDRFHAPNVTRCDYHFGTSTGFVITSQMTPIEPMRTRVYTLISYRLKAARRLARLVQPLMHAYTRAVIQQDVRIMRVQKQGLANGEARFHSTGADRVHIEIKRMVDALRARGSTPPAAIGTRPMRFVI